MTTPPCIAVAGASGFVGRALVKTLRRQGHRVIAMSRGALPEPHADNRLLSDLEHQEPLIEAMAPASIMIHLAARAHQTHGRARFDDRHFDQNAIVTRALLGAAIAGGLRRTVLLSSIGVHGRRTTQHRFSETTPLAPDEPYARSKYQCEQIAQGLSQIARHELVILRPPLVYGPGAPGNFGRLVRVIDLGWPLPLGRVQNLRSMIGIDNLVDAILLCAVHPAAANKTYLLSDDEEISTPDLMLSVGQALGKRVQLWPVPYLLLKAMATVVGQVDTLARLCDSLQIDSGKIRRDLGWCPPLTLVQGLARLNTSRSN